jgi:uncharacterized DUF497 family protein
MSLPIHASARVRKKLLEKHGVTMNEVEQCFLNHLGKNLQDTRTDHQTNPPTLWFIAETNHLRKLKVVFVLEFDNSITLKTAYEPNPAEIAIYYKYA